MVEDVLRGHAEALCACGGTNYDWSDYLGEPPTNVIVLDALNLNQPVTWTKRTKQPMQLPAAHVLELNHATLRSELFAFYGVLVCRSPFR